MDRFHIWFDLKESARDLELAASIDRYLGYLRERSLIEGWKLERRKLGFGPPELGEFHLAIETLHMAQLEQAFQRAASRDAEVEPLHAAVYSLVKNAKFGLYRDFPDDARAP